MRLACDHAHEFQCGCGKAFGHSVALCSISVPHEMPMKIDELAWREGRHVFCHHASVIRSTFLEGQAKACAIIVQPPITLRGCHR